MTISIGQIAIVVTLLTLLWRVERAYNLYSVEHEILMADYCEREGIDLHKLPTRSKGLSSRRGS